MFYNRFTIANRKRKSIELQKQVISESKKDSAKREFESELNRLSVERIKAVIQNYKLTDKGIVSFKSFEGYSRRLHHNSLANLLNYNPDSSDYWKEGKPFDESLGFGVKDVKDYRLLNKQQAREVRKMCDKLSYYTGKRKFIVKKKKEYSMKVAFITLTTPPNCSDQQSLKAFDGFLDYLRRTANCVYVWKKELGEDSNRLHYHIMVNNFVPYYIISWKWKRLLLNQGVIWSLNEKGEETNSHSRIELPRNEKQTGKYISKYVAKDCELKRELGYIWGCSDVLRELKEVVLIESEVENDELWNLIKSYKTITTDYVGIVCCDLTKVKKLAPMLYNIFMKQYFNFRDTLTLPQRFQGV